MKTKKFTLKFWGAMLAVVLSVGVLNAQNTPVAKNGQLKVTGLKLCNQYGYPIQLRGMSTHGIQWYGWGGCLNEASLDALAYDWGSDILRISLYVQEGGYESNPTGFTNQVHTLINEATERGMYALVDWHQLTPGDPNYNLARAKTFFTAIANQHKDKNNIIYDICNEPNGVSWNAIKTYADQIIPVIRAIDSDAVILVGTHAWGSMGISDGRTAQDIVSNPVNATNIMYTFHFYAADHGNEYYNELNWASDRLPVFVTEFGTQEASGDGGNDFTMSQKYIDLLRTKKISWTNWNYSDDNRSGAVWIPGTCNAGPWTTARLKPAGAWIRERMLSPADDFPGGGNISPITNITSPGSGSSFNAPATITINANASDADGSVSKVEFYNGANKIGEDASVPYSFTWTNVAAGNYSITTKAIDNQNATGTSSVVSVTVVGVIVQSPYSGTPYPIPGKIEAENYDLGGQNVAFNELTAGNSGSSYRTDAVDIEACTDAGAGFNVGWIQANEWLEYTVNVTTAGTYKVETRVAAIATGKSFRIEMDGASIGTFTVPNTGNWQAWQTVTVNNISLTAGQKIMRFFAITGDFNLNNITFSSSVVTNTPPTVSLTAPANNATFTAPATVNITATASDPGGSVTKVEFFNGANKLGEDATSPYSYSWTGVAAGSYAITAMATDNGGLTATSSVANITVTTVTNTPPTITLTAPASGATFTAPATINITATATDAEGISKVEFYNGANKLGEDASSPYSYTWTGVASGAYSISAKVIDNGGLTATTPSRSITVTGSTDVCASIAQYVENSGYVAGSIVKNTGARYECKPWPYSGWCNGAAWAYAPGSGAYWTDAWTLVGTCSARIANAEMQALSNTVVIAPNPASSSFRLDFAAAGFNTAAVKLVDNYGNTVLSISDFNSGEELNVAQLKAGVYVVHILSGESNITKKLVKND